MKLDVSRRRRAHFTRYAQRHFRPDRCWISCAETSPHQRDFAEIRSAGGNRQMTRSGTRGAGAEVRRFVPNLTWRTNASAIEPNALVPGPR